MIDFFEIPKPKESFDDMFLCKYEPNTRLIDLYEKWKAYIRDAENLSRKDSILKSREFYQWAEFNGFDRRDINHIKKWG